ncbi:MAG: CinA family nicotinamide mononucleotide deamidase-related protein [Trueperaceae bacterium]
MPEIRSAEIVSVGTELLLGEVIDTNGARLAADLAARGVDVYRSQRVGDNLERIREAIENAVGRSDLVVVGGGLGPTDDDLTRDAIAAVAGQPQRVDPGLERWLRERFASYGRAMPERNLQQARVIDAATVLANPIGTAPGWLVRLQRDGSERVIVTLPGPPREFDRMWQREAVPLLVFPPDHLFVRTFKTIGIGESHVAEKLGALTLSSNPTVATYAKRDGVHVRVAAKAESREAAALLARSTVDQVRERIGRFVWGSDGDELADLALRALVARGKRVAILEGATGGLLSTLLTDAADTVPGANVGGDGGGPLAGSVIAWDLDRMRALGVPFDLLLRLPAGAADIVSVLAAAVRAFFAADIGIAIGHPMARDGHGSTAATRPGASVGDVGPEEDQRAPVRVMIAIAADAGTTVETLDLPPLGRPWLRERAAFTSLHLLRSALR